MLAKVIVAVSWLLVIGSVAARQLIYRKNKSGFIISMIVNILFAAYYFIFAKEYASVVLMVVFTMQSCYGLYYWCKDKIKKGDTVTVKYKGDKVTGRVLDLRKRTFIIKLDNGKKTWRYYHQLRKSAA